MKDAILVTYIDESRREYRAVRVGDDWDGLDPYDDAAGVAVGSNQTLLLPEECRDLYGVDMDNIGQTDDQRNRAEAERRRQNEWSAIPTEPIGRFDVIDDTDGDDPFADYPETRP